MNSSPSTESENGVQVSYTISFCNSGAPLFLLGVAVREDNVDAQLPVPDDLRAPAELPNAVERYRIQIEFIERHLDHAQEPILRVVRKTYVHRHTHKIEE